LSFSLQLLVDSSCLSLLIDLSIILI